MIRRYQNSWTQKITQEKSTKFIKIFESYQVFIHKFLFQAVIYIYISYSQKSIETFWVQKLNKKS